MVKCHKKLQNFTHSMTLVMLHVSRYVSYSAVPIFLACDQNLIMIDVFLAMLLLNFLSMCPDHCFHWILNGVEFILVLQMTFDACLNEDIPCVLRSSPTVFIKYSFILWHLTILVTWQNHCISNKFFVQSTNHRAYSLNYVLIFEIMSLPI